VCMANIKQTNTPKTLKITSSFDCCLFPRSTLLFQPRRNFRRPLIIMPPFNEDVSLGFTSSLLETLKASRVKVRAFVEAQNAAVDSEVVAYNQKVSQEQSLIDQLADSLEALKLERGLAAADETPEGLVQRKEEMLAQQNKLKEQIEKLDKERSKRQKDLEAMRKEEADYQLRAADVRDMKAKVEEAKKTTVDDLTRGIVNYKYLGLDFEKAEGNKLRFTFTQLDAGEPSRTFFFQLKVNDDEVYEVDNCQPAIPTSTLMRMTDGLNQTDDLSAFVRGMRNAFSDLV